jgi:phosphoglycerate dehydrogenase-like enzyme
LAAELGLRLFHIDRPRADEIADSAMALMLVLLRRTHDLATQRCGRISWAPGYTSLRGMKRLRGKVIGLLGTDKSAVALAQRARGFKMKVIFLDLQQVRTMVMLTVYSMFPC